MTLSPKARRIKGHSFERKIARDLQKIDPTSKRNLEYQEGCGIDISTKLPFSIQCKAQKRINWLSAYQEIQKNQNIPLVVGKITNKGEYVFLKWSDFLKIIQRCKL